MDFVSLGLLETARHLHVRERRGGQEGEVRVEGEQGEEVGEGSVGEQGEEDGDT